jgi:heat shock protein 1/8
VIYLKYTASHEKQIESFSNILILLQNIVDTTTAFTILVFDFGGGTCDISILEIKGNRFTVKASQGDNKLGGEDFDDMLAEHLSKIIEEKENYKINAMNFRRLRNQCERAKRYLSTQDKFSIEIEKFIEETKPFQYEITRKEYEDITKDLVSRVLEPVEKCIEEAKISKNDIQEIILVGGSSRIPSVQKTLTEFFNGKELNKEINPDEAIAYGAALQAAQLKDSCTEKFTIHDITPFSLGTSVIGNRLDIIIPKNEILPATVTKTYATTSDNQRIMTVDVFQGEYIKDISKNLKIGDFTINNLTKAPRGLTKIDITFALDHDGVLHVTAKEVGTSNVETRVIEKGIL